MAGTDWMNPFLEIVYCSPPIHRPGPASLARAMNFNLPHINILSDSLYVLHDRKFESHNVNNVDETDVYTVKVPNIIIALLSPNLRFVKRKFNICT